MVWNDGVVCNEGVVGKASIHILDTIIVTASDARQSSFKTVDCFTAFAMTLFVTLRLV
jgi:hypothetical protein